MGEDRPHPLPVLGPGLGWVSVLRALRWFGGARRQQQRCRHPAATTVLDQPRGHVDQAGSGRRQPPVLWRKRGTRREELRVAAAQKTRKQFAVRTVPSMTPDGEQGGHVWGGKLTLFRRGIFPEGLRLGAAAGVICKQPSLRVLLSNRTANDRWRKVR